MRLIIVSNRSPISIVKENGHFRYEESSGGLASGLRTYVDQIKKSPGSEIEILWMGWPGASVDDEGKARNEILSRFGVHSIFLSEEVMEKFYAGFCNKTLWPLFHYFPAYAVYEKEYWEQYTLVNELYCNELLKILEPGDVIWIHDYHLMLLPEMIRKYFPSATIGFFLHIPFPSYEIFRLLPSEWRKKILEGMYGADLIGFHTHDYCTYFLRSTMRILGLNNHMGEVYVDGRLVKVSTFPMGIDYQKFHDTASAKGVQNEKMKLGKNLPSPKTILSIDRQDYSKGILNRLKGYEYFLEMNPQWQKKVTMIMIVIPSRIGVESYQDIKSRIDEMVGKINGKFGSMEWMPIVYQYRSVSFGELIAHYHSSDVALVTPLRDGMNLIAKEYVASRNEGSGVLVLSEMAGAVDELTESIIINPNNTEEIGDALLQALEMNETEQKKRIRLMQKRLETYDVFKWSNDFLTTLKATKKKQQRLHARFLNGQERKNLVTDFKEAGGRTLFLDYDGTLVPHINRLGVASPGKELLNILDELTRFNNTEVVIISGRGKFLLDHWFGHLPVNIVAEHGAWYKEKEDTWKMLKPIRSNWMKKIIPIMDHYAEKLPGAFVEAKEFSLVFHYRESNPDLAAWQVSELLNHLTSFTSNMDIQILEGNHSLEICNAGIDKGVAAMHWLSKSHSEPHFILSIGDDRTDEDIFRVMPPEAYSIKIGNLPSYAKFNLGSSRDVINLLKELSSGWHGKLSELKNLDVLKN